MVSSTHPDIIEFMTIYEQIQLIAKGKPEQIPFLYRNNPKFAELCRRIEWLHFVFENRIKESGDTVLENVDQRFIAKWRHYENELDAYIGKLIAHDLLVSLKLIDQSDASFEKTVSNKDADFKKEAEEEFDAIQLRLELGSIERVGESDVDDEVVEKVHLGEMALKRLFKSLGLNLKTALYQQKMLTTVHIPTHASFGKSKHAITLSEALNEAH